MAIHPTFQAPTRLATTVLLALLAAACAAVPKPLPQPVPVPVPGPKPRPVPVPAPADWRDAPQTPGDWRWLISGGNSVASFGRPGTPLAMLTCDQATRTVLLARAGNAVAAVPMTVRTTYGQRPLTSDPTAAKPGWIAARLTPRDAVLDQIAFSRGRFTIEVAGQPALYLPAWPELSRVIEDCR